MPRAGSIVGTGENEMEELAYLTRVLHAMRLSFVQSDAKNHGKVVSRGLTDLRSGHRPPPPTPTPLQDCKQ